MRQEERRGNDVWPRRDEDDPTLGVREPIKPSPSTSTGGAALEPPRNDYAEAQGLAESPLVVVG
jgi:hypothetical protein